jgi:hypothetical protein
MNLPIHVRTCLGNRSLELYPYPAFPSRPPHQPPHQAEGFRGTGGEGLANLAGSTAVFNCTESSWKMVRPSVQVETHLNGTFTPDTVR